jgi:hypothetical protein
MRHHEPFHLAEPCSFVGLRMFFYPEQRAENRSASDGWPERAHKR